MRQNVKMDVTRLILEVQKRPSLWNQKHVLYHNRDATNSVWIEIAAILKLPQEILKTKWKGLRDTFRAEIKKEKMSRKNQHSKTKSKWRHYKNLLFLKDQMIPQLPVWEKKTANHYDELNAQDIIENDDYPITRSNIKLERKKKTIQKNSNKNNSNHAKCRTRSKKSMKAESVTTAALYQQYEFLHDQELSSSYTESSTNNENFIIKQEPIDITISENDEQIATPESLNENDILQKISTGQVIMTRANDTCVELSVDPLAMNRLDDNYHFLMSLLPHIKTLPAQQQMLLRIQIQELVYKEVYRKNTDKNCPHPS